MTEEIRDLVSTIIPVYNRPDMLRQAVESVLIQTWRPIEIIITDDGSTDTTPEVGKSYALAYPDLVRYVWNPNRGAGPARESGRQLARGEFIQYLDSDDTLWPRKFEVQIAALRANPECGVAYGQIRLCPEGEMPMKKPHKWSGRSLPTLFPWLLVDRWWNTDAPLWRRSACQSIGPWSDLRYSQDWEYDARAGALGIRLAYCPEFVCDQRHHADNRQTGTGRWLSPDDRVRFFSQLLRSALKAGVAADSPEMRHFSRWVFSNARQSAELGNADAARRLCAIAVESSQGASLDIHAFVAAGSLLGWKRVARLVDQGRARLGRGPGRHTRKQSWVGTKDDDA